MNFALIKNGKVDVIVGLQPTNVSQWDMCVPCNLNVQVGDDYNGSVFMRNGTEVLSNEQIVINTLNAEKLQLQEDNDALMDMLYEADGGEPINEDDA